MEGLVVGMARLKLIYKLLFKVRCNAKFPLGTKCHIAGLHHILDITFLQLYIVSVME